MNISIPDLISIIRDAGVIGILIAIIYGGAKRWWVWGWQYLEMEKELAMWRNLALRSTTLARKALEASEKEMGDEQKTSEDQEEQTG
jgi:hypothetical protein